MARKNLVKQISVKQDDNTLGTFYDFGASFADIVDTRIGMGNFSLEQFFDNYMSFMKENAFVFVGIDQPTNKHISLWIDTGHTNHDTYGEK